MRARPQTIVVAGRKCVDALDPMDEASLLEGIEGAIDGLRTTQAGTAKPREQLIGGERGSRRRAQRVEHQGLVPR
jgi:hypothetical protein